MRKLFGYFGHHKCASTWFEDIFREVSYDLGLRYAVVYVEQDFGGDLKKYVADNGIDFIAYANADYAQVARLENMVGVHAVRDPRDIVVSAYFSHLKTHPTEAWPELLAYREKLAQCGPEEGLLYEIDFRKSQFEEMRSWERYTGNNVLQLRMEEATGRPYESMLETLRFMGLLHEEHYGAVDRFRYLSAKVARRMERRLGIPMPHMLSRLPAERLLGIVWENGFAKKTGGRKPGTEATDSHYRKGVSGDWKNHLNAQHIAAMKTKYNDLILQYGYEAHEAW